LRPMQFLLPPTVLDELGNKAIEDPDPSVRQAAELAMLQFRPRWHMQPVDFNAVQEAIAKNAMRLLRDSGLMPYEERNDAALISEAAILECVLLVSRDSHLLDIGHEKLALLFGKLDLAPLSSHRQKTS
jgi:hypothetical protein